DADDTRCDDQPWRAYIICHEEGKDDAEQNCMADGVSRHRQSAQYEKYTGYTCSKGSHDEDKQNFDHEAPPPILLLYMLFLMMPFGAQHKESTIRKESVRMMAGPVAMFSPAVLMYVPVKAANAPETP